MKYTNIAKLAAAAVVAATALSAQADVGQGYAGLKVAPSFLSAGTSTLFGAYGGYNLSNNAAVEVDYLYGGTFFGDANGISASASGHVAQAFGVYRQYLDNQSPFYGKAKLGAGAVTVHTVAKSSTNANVASTSSSNSSDSSSDAKIKASGTVFIPMVSASVGAGYDVTPNTSIELQYQHNWLLGSAGVVANVNGKTVTETVSANNRGGNFGFASIGAHVKF